MNPPFRVFLCSTYTDLADERALVLDAIRKLQLQHHAMEFFGARPELPIEACLAEVRRSDLIVVIAGDRYGSLVPGRDVSYCEAEYEEAHRLGKLALIYLRNRAESLSLPSIKQDAADEVRLHNWKANLTARHTAAFFTNAQGLSVQVIADISRILVENLTPIEREPAAPAPPIGFMNWYEGTVFEPAPFGGRDAELATLHGWLADGYEPYALLTAPIGRGKSALMSRFVTEVRSKARWHVIFVPISVRFGSSQPTHFLRDLVRHFARLQGRTVPAQATASEWDALWRECFSEGPPTGHRPILLVIDALDEAQNWMPDAGFLPDLTTRVPDLRSRLRVLATARDPSDGDRWRRHLGWTSPRLALSLSLSTLDGAGVYSAMASLGHPLDALADPVRWTAALLRVTQGEPLLVRFYAAELLARAAEGTQLSLATLAQRPPGLAGYVEDWWSEQQALWGEARDRRAADVTTLLDILAIARGPLTLADLLALQQSGPGAVRQAIDTARRFLAGDGSDADPFVLGHPALAEFFRDRLSVPERDVHARFVEWAKRVLEDLSEVANDGSPRRSAVPPYLFTTLRYHLSAVRAQVSEWSRLLAIPWIDASIQATSSADAVTADIDAVWDAIEAAGGDDAGPGVPMHWPEMVTCGLIQTSLRAERQAIPVTLACRAATLQYWSLGRFLFYLNSRTEKAMDRKEADAIARTLLTLGPDAVRAALRTGLSDGVVRVLSLAYAAALTSEEKSALNSDGPLVKPKSSSNEEPAVPTCEPPNDTLLAAVFAAAEMVATTIYGLSVASPVVDLAPHVPDGWARALAVAETIEDAYFRARTFIAVAPHVPGGWPRALAAAEAIEDAADRSYALQDVAPHMPEGWARVLAAAEAIDHSYNRARRIIDVAPHLPDGWARALAAAEAIEDAADRSYALQDVAPYVTEGWARARAAAEAIESRQIRAEVLLAMAPDVPNGWARALAAAEAAEVGRTYLTDMIRGNVLVKVAPHVPDGWARALAAAEAVDDGPEYRAYRLSEVAPHVPEGWTRALAAAEAIEGADYRASALIAVAPHVPDGWMRALAAAEALTNPAKRAEALIEVAPHVPDGWVRALAAAGALRDPCKRAETFVALAPHVPDGWAQALAAAEATSRDVGNRALALAALAPHVPDGWTRALAAAEAIAHPVARWRAFAAMAPHVSNGWARARAAAEALEDAKDRADALLVVAPNVPDGWARALAVAETIEDGHDRAYALIALAAQLPDLWARALAATETIKDASDRVNALVGVAPHVPGGWARALAAAETIKPPPDRVSALIRVAPHVPDGWARVLAAVEGFGNSGWRVDALVGMAPHVPDGWTRALAAADSAQDAGDRALWLIKVAPHVPDGWARVIAAAEAIDDRDPTDSRARAFIAAAPHIPNGWDDALFMTMFTRSKDRARALVALAPHVPEELLPHALSVARTIDDKYRADALTALASRLPELLLELSWKACPSLFDLIAETRSRLEGRVRVFRREFSAITSTPAEILALVSRLHNDDQRWTVPTSVAVQLVAAIEAVGRRWP